ncbi:protein NATD1 isoform X2 [Drosophila nasuta]|uniref:Protein NATD1 n=2 Tax=nasuta subgroup TaxID=32307 RepID=A0A6P8XH43_DROAB|nr:protein NATD1 [Drosophila albomicans]XP_060646265.1 protein NATD1 isoform X2 [Drosophila nasuta]
MYSTDIQYKVINCGIKCLGRYSIIGAIREPEFCRRTQNFCVFQRVNVLVSYAILPTPRRWMGTTFKIKHDDSRFYIETKEGVAQLKYDINDGIMHIKHTGVPTALGGHGIGKLLAKAALDYGVQSGLILKVSCGFVKNYVEVYEPQFLKYIMH